MHDIYMYPCLLPLQPPVRRIGPHRRATHLAALKVHPPLGRKRRWTSQNEVRFGQASARQACTQPSPGFLTRGRRGTTSIASGLLDPACQHRSGWLSRMGVLSSCAWIPVGAAKWWYQWGMLAVARPGGRLVRVAWVCSLHLPTLLALRSRCKRSQHEGESWRMCQTERHCTWSITSTFRAQ